MSRPAFHQYYTNHSSSGLLQRRGVLAVVSFDSMCEESEELGVIPTGLKSLSGLTREVICCEGGMAERGQSDGCSWNIIDDVMCASVWISELECLDITNAVRSAYMKLYGVLREKGFPNAFRFWNFMPNINSGVGDCEEYKKFCLGRQQAFDDLGVQKLQYPAASALGHHGKGAVIYVLASRSARVIHHENPRQQSAYHYPRQYGPASPSFSRATSVDMSDSRQILISGTASILGHKTHAPLSCDEQLNVTVGNIDRLMLAIAEKPHPLHAVRVYLRSADDFERAQSVLAGVYAEQATNFLLADICRANLLVEIEAASSVPFSVTFESG